MLLRIILKSISALVVALFAWSLITAEVVSAPPGVSPHEYNEQLKNEGKPGRYVLASGADVDSVGRNNRFLGAFLLAIAAFLLVWGWNDWRRRNSWSKTAAPNLAPRPVTLRSEDVPYIDSPGMRLTRNPYLPLLMECSNCSQEFRLHVNSAALEGFECTDEIGSTECPLCGAGIKIIPQNTRAVSFREAERFPMK